ncbi:hypothetical protein [Idiomarina abyssalis]|uniref:hypothetical protein n=1 Tax=Idiomarina abyssalis TaxID=86102 RepID=UPI003A9405D5
MPNRSEELISQIDSILSLYAAVEESWNYSSSMGGAFTDYSGYESVMTQTISVIEHIFGPRHPNYQRILHAYNEHSKRGLLQAKGILNGIQESIRGGFLSELESSIRVDIKSDFLSTAQELAEQGEKDAASVLAVSVLEDSIKQIARSNGLDDLIGKEMSTVVNGLAAKSVIERTTQRALLSFKPLRNAAFHANWDQVTIDMVNMLLSFLPSFIERYRK